MTLHKILDTLLPQRTEESDDLLLAASSFEPRCCRVGELLAPKAIQRSIVFRYSDTLDSALGMANTRTLSASLKAKSIFGVEILDCSFADPYSVVRALRTWQTANNSSLDKSLAITVDISCFTKLHLLLLLEHLDRELEGRVQSLRIIYTEPLSYAASFGRQLTYGIQDTVYIPFSSPDHDAGHTALLAFLGYEVLRTERIIEELEPDLSILVQGSQGYSDEIYSTNLNLNRALLARVRYNHQYRLLSGSPRDFIVLASALEGVIKPLSTQGFGTFYLAPLGTKLQAVSFEILRRSNPHIRFLLSYAIPQRYERKYYSQGVGPSWSGSIPNNRTASPQELIEVAGIYYGDPFEIPVTALNRAAEHFNQASHAMVMRLYNKVLTEFFETPEVIGACLSEGAVVRATTSREDLNEEFVASLQRETGRLCYIVWRDEFERNTGSK